MSIEIQSINIDNMTREEWEAFSKKGDALMERKRILERYEDKIHPLKGKRKGYWCTIGGVQKKKTKLEDLEDLIIEYETHLSNPTLVSIYEDFKTQRKKDGIDDETIKKYDYFYNTFLVGSELGEMPIKDIKIRDGREFQDHVKSVKPDAKLKYWQNQHGILNKMLSYAVNYIDSAGIDHNPLKELNDEPSKNFWCEKLRKSKQDLYYTDSEMQQIIGVAFDDFHKRGNPAALGIVVLFCTAVRVGELCGLKWKDINSSYISIRRQYTGGEVKPCKSESSNADIPIDSAIYDVFMMIKESNLKLGFPVSDDEFVSCVKIHRRETKAISFHVQTDVLMVD